MRYAVEEIIDDENAIKILKEVEAAVNLEFFETLNEDVRKGINMSLKTIQEIRHKYEDELEHYKRLYPPQYK